MAEATGGRVDRHARTRRSGGWVWVVAGVVVLALVAGGIFIWSRGRTSDEASVAELEEAIAEAGDVPAVPAEGAWRPLPPLPLPPRDEQAAAWTGEELAIWGGALDDGFGRRTFHADGAALDPAAGTWRPLPQAPLEPRTDHLVAWTGSQLIVWGGTGRTGLLADGAVYDPATDRWRTLPQAPLSPRADAAAVWTGTELLVLGGADNAGPLTDAAAYDPDSSSWRPVAQLPEGFGSGAEVEVVWAGDAAVAWTADRGGLGFTQVARYDGAADAWTPLPDAVGSAAGLPILIPGDARIHGLRVSNDGTAAELVTLDAGATEWTATPAPAPRGDPWESTGVWTGSAALIVAGDGSGATAYRPDDGSWTLLPEAPAAPPGAHSVAWTGQDLLVVAGAPAEDPTGDATGTAAWTFRQ